MTDVPEGKVVESRLHLDLKIGGGRDVPLETRKQRVNARVEELTALGVTTLRVTEAPEADHSRLLRQFAAAGAPGRDIILTDPASYRLAVDQKDLDLRVFRRVRNEARSAEAAGGHEIAAHQFRAALGLWRGPALAGTSMPDG
jgi:hypothetical protein